MQFQNYSIIKELGQGGMATVYLAEHNLLKNKIALKILKEEFTRNKNIRNRFLSEARNLATMSHPNIIKVTDLIDEGDTVAFVMEHIDGETLKECLDRKGKLTDDEIRSIFSQMLEAVGYVHKKALVHRDIKPSNFMIDKEGTVKLLDFGIAKNTDTSSAEYTQTGTGMQMGTPMYMSPEQVKNTKEVTFQSDIYSLGVVLWQMVMGKKPYDQNTLSIPEIQVSIIKEPLLKTGSAFDSIIQKATEKDLNKRYTNSASFLTAIKSHVEHEEKTIVNTFDEKTVVANQEKKLSLKKKNTENLKTSTNQGNIKNSDSNPDKIEDSETSKKESVKKIYSKLEKFATEKYLVNINKVKEDIKNKTISKELNYIESNYLIEVENTFKFILDLVLLLLVLCSIIFGIYYVWFEFIDFSNVFTSKIWSSNWYYNLFSKIGLTFLAILIPFIFLGIVVSALEKDKKELAKKIKHFIESNEADLNI